MDFKKGDWTPGQAFDVEKYQSDLLDDKMAKNLVGDLKRNLPPGGFPKHKPVITTPSGAPAKVAKRGTSQGDSDLLTKMTQRLQQLEAVN